MVKIGNDTDKEDALHLNGSDADIPGMIDDRDRPIREHVVPILDDLNPRIVKPQIQALNFELKPMMFRMLQIVRKFSGLPTEDSRLLLRRFLEVCDSFKQQGALEDALRLKLFPYSLRDRARAWLNALLLRRVASWNELLQRVGTGRRVARIMELDATTSLIVQVSSLNNMIRTLKRLVVVQEMKAVELTCVYYGEDHVFYECPANPASVCYMGNFNRNNNRIPMHTIHDGNNILISVGNVKSTPPRYNQPLPQQNVQLSSTSSSSMEALLKEYMAKNNAII
ncbi:protein FAR1-RELATED SEQUENCE 5-like [Gossypium australe]|uniref:Protein FAR1-RELATED SEQUENCE 5-like n=1 Tax=Gossypium australe TaxID=47621 RepID=A0A5B6UXH0_9ROSI|nr:protein FAR1-RELATED SEQUENCE 5-like [Gossypium australe]